MTQNKCEISPFFADMRTFIELKNILFETFQTKFNWIWSVSSRWCLNALCALQRSDNMVTPWFNGNSPLKDCSFPVACIFLVACTRLNDPLCPSIGRSVGNFFFFFSNFMQFKASKVILSQFTFSLLAGLAKKPLF